MVRVPKLVPGYPERIIPKPQRPAEIKKRAHINSSREMPIECHPGT